VHLLSASVSNFSEGAETQLQDIREIGPTMVFYSTRLWKGRQEKSRQKLKNGGLKKAAYNLFLPWAINSPKPAEKTPICLYEKVQEVIADFLLFRPIRDSLACPMPGFAAPPAPRSARTHTVFITHSIYLSRAFTVPPKEERSRELKTMISGRTLWAH